MSCSVWRQPITIAWLYPPSKKGGWLSTKDFSFGAAIFDYVPPPEEELRTLLERWIDQFSSDDFAEYISSKGVKAWAVGYEAAAARVIFTLIFFETGAYRSAGPSGRVGGYQETGLGFPMAGADGTGSRSPVRC